MASFLWSSCGARCAENPVANLAAGAYASARDNDVEGVRAVLEVMDPDTPDASGMTLLHHAAATNSVAVARLLVKCGADVQAKTRASGQTALDLSRSEDMRDVLRSGDPELSWIYDSSMSLASAGGGMLADTPRAAAAQAAAQAAQGSLAAAASGEPPAKAESPDPYGWRRGLLTAAVYKPPAAAARASGSGAASEGSAEATYSRHAAKERAAAAAAAAVCSAAYFGTVEGLDAALRRGGSVSSRDETGMTPLHWAAHGGHCDVAQALLQRGSDLSATNRDGWTPLHFAACAGHVGMVKQLLRAGAVADAPNAAGRTPLQMAKDANVEAAFRNWG